MELARAVDLLRFRRKREAVLFADRARDAGQWDLAARFYRKALNRNPLSSSIWVQYGHALKESGGLRDPDKLTRAEFAYRRALSLDPGLADTHLQLGHVLKLQGKTDDARSAYLRAVALDPSTPHPLDELRGLGWSEAHISELLTLVELGGAEAQHSDRQDGPTADLAVSHAAEIRESSLLPIYNDEGKLPSLERNIDRTKVPNNRRITISLLTFSQFDRCVTLVSQLCDWLADKSDLLGISFTIIVRNNNPHLHITEFQEQWTKLEERFSSIRFMLFDEGFNVGFGSGHNLNFAAAESDYFLILNDDIAFPHINWLVEALDIFGNRPNVGAIGASNNPNSITPFFANGVFDRHGNRWPLRYAEASVLLIRSKVFTEIGQFDKAYDWVYCEDADFSFRIQAHGYELDWVEIPHEHWRASSFNVLPDSTKSSILEHNRSVLYSKWNVAISENKIGKSEIYDVWSEGIGDIFCGLLHLKKFTDGLTLQQKQALILNTSCPELAQSIFSDEVVIESLSDRQQLRHKYSAQGVRSFKSTRNVNYGLPFNIHVLVCAALGIPVAANEEIKEILLERPGGRHIKLAPLQSIPSYCVLHLESDRADHDGRVPMAATLRSIAAITADVFDHVVLVGKRNLLCVEDLASRKNKITDLQGQLSIASLLDVISGANAFVGIDSFPAHIAQVANVPSAVFFGSVHPSFRVLSERRTWPIVKPIDCIGCYHVSLEPGVPFCMRRDVSCTTDIDPEILRRAIAGCASKESFDWGHLATQALELQRKFFMKMLFHPAPERRFFDTGGVPIGTASNLVYQIVDQVHDAVLASGRVG
jgi:Glycosyltransferase family 9 (heptosyltransferase)/Tetratricopeptide repeat